MTIHEFEIRLLVAFALGALIGLERQMRHKMAGLRTNALVSLGAALFVLMAERITGDSSSAARVASQIVTGIGFLGAGVIMKDGFNVVGLNTAATIWCAGAIGSLSGMGLWYEASVGTAFVLVTHFVLRPLGKKINTLSKIAEDGEYYYSLRITCKEDKTDEIRAHAFILIEKSGLIIKEMNINDVSNDHQSILNISVFARHDAEAAIEELLSALSLEEGIYGAGWEQGK